MWRVYYVVEDEPTQHYMDAWHKNAKGARDMVSEHLDDALMRDGKDRQIVEIVQLTKIGDDF